MKHTVQRISLTHEEIYHKMWKESQAGAYISYLRGKNCRTEDAFLWEVAASFQFPYYYGGNWAAFDECIQDLEWLNFSRIFVVFDDFSEAFRDQPSIQSMLQERIVDYWSSAIRYWVLEGKTVEVWLNN
jgi:hypothetical protein